MELAGSLRSPSALPGVRLAIDDQSSAGRHRRSPSFSIFPFLPSLILLVLIPSSFLLPWFTRTKEDGRRPRGHRRSTPCQPLAVTTPSSLFPSFSSLPLLLGYGMAILLRLARPHRTSPDADGSHQSWLGPSEPTGMPSGPNQARETREACSMVLSPISSPPDSDNTTPISPSPPHMKEGCQQSQVQPRHSLATARLGCPAPSSSLSLSLGRGPIRPPFIMTREGLALPCVHAGAR